MKNLITLIIIVTYGLKAAAFSTDQDSIKQNTMVAATNLDSLQQQLKVTTYDSLKSGVYIQIAAQYLKYDSITNKKIRLNYQTEALNYTYLALHLYSRYNDTIGLRTCFNNLAKVYRSQKKYSQAKWFILQSNSLSRIKKDVPNILSSLIELAAIKMEIKDYKLAMRDLNEALKLSTTNHYAHTESAVQQSYALLYSRMKNYPKEAIALKRHNFIEDSIRKSEEAHLIAKINTQDSLQNKKKVRTIINKKVYKVNSTKRIASI
jgi:tetratricopeptide (TPR) repeat protein